MKLPFQNMIIQTLEIQAAVGIVPLSRRSVSHSCIIKHGCHPWIISHPWDTDEMGKTRRLIIWNSEFHFCKTMQTWLRENFWNSSLTPSGTNWLMFHAKTLWINILIRYVVHRSKAPVNFSTITSLRPHSHYSCPAGAQTSPVSDSIILLSQSSRLPAHLIRSLRSDISLINLLPNLCY